MKKIAIPTLVAGLLGLLTLFFVFSRSQPPPSSLVHEEANVGQQEEDRSVESSKPKTTQSPSAYVLTLPNQLEYQLSPKKRYAERMQEEAEDRFRRLAQREKRIEKPVKRGEPISINIQDAVSVAQHSENLGR